MTQLVIQHREIEAQIKSLENELRAIEANPRYAQERAFLDALEGLLGEYGKSLSDVVKILDPQATEPQRARGARGPAPGTMRKKLRYKNPHTGEHIDTAGANNRTLKAWKLQYPNDNIKDWIVGESK